MTGIKMSMDSWIPIILIQLEQKYMKPSHASLTLWENRKNRFIFVFILMNKFNYKSSIVTISCLKYLLTLFIDDIGIIDNYLSYPWLIRLLCGFVLCTRSHPHI